MSARAHRVVIGILVFVVLMLGAMPSFAQATPRLQLFGGVSYLRFDSRTLGFANDSNLEGYNVSAAFNIFRFLGVAGELSGQYGPHINFRDMAVGPQYLRRMGKVIVFGHFLYGKGRTFDSIGSAGGDTNWAYLIGGGADLDYRHHLAIRVLQVDYVHSEVLGAKQQSVRVSAGVVYHIGRHSSD
jgi:hypothetical protein